jgi:aminopeptidase N
MRISVLLVALCFPVLLNAASPQVDVIAYRTDLAFDVQQGSVTGSAQILLTNSTAVPLTCIPLDLVGMTVMSVEVEGIGLPWTHDFGALCVFLSIPLEKGDTLSLRVEYGGMPVCDQGRGPVFGEVSYCMPQGRYCDYLCMTSHWMPINNSISDLATWDLTFTVAEDLTVASIGSLVDHAASHGMSRYRWVESVPTPPHAVTWAIADYACVRDRISDIPAAYYILSSDEAKAAAYFAPVAEMISLYTELLGPWPAEKIGFCWTPAGAAQGQGMIPINITSWEGGAAAREAHEIAHQWFGNSLVPTSVTEQWLSEGFATYLEWLFAAGGRPDAAFDAMMRVRRERYINDVAREEGVFPLYDFRSHIIDNAPATVHEKGALVLNMLRHVMGDAAFEAGLREYVSTYRASAVTSELFRGTMQAHTEADLHPFLEQWVYREGWPVYAVSRFGEDPDGPFRLCVRQEQDAYGWPLFAMPIEVEFVTCAGDTLRYVRDAHAAKQDILVFDEVMDKNIASWRMDPDGWLLGEVTFASGVGASHIVPASLAITSVHPHPLGAGPATLRLDLRRPATVQVELRDLLGRRVSLLQHRTLDAGFHDLPLTLPSVPPGSYHIVATGGGAAAVRNILIH